MGRSAIHPPEYLICWPTKNEEEASGNERAQRIWKTFVAYDACNGRRASPLIWRIERCYVSSAGGRPHGACRTRLGKGLREEHHRPSSALGRPIVPAAALTGALRLAPYF